MPFLFSYVCDLLQKLDDNRTARSGLRPQADIINEWFRTYQGLLQRDDHDTAALLSTLLPEKRNDRVFFLKEKRLQTVIGRGLRLGVSRIKQLDRWNHPSAGIDLAESVQSILLETPNPFPGGVTVEEVDGLLHRIAAACRFSSPAVRKSIPACQAVDREQELGDLYTRLSARDAKWFTRLILKNFEPVVLDPQVIYRNYHPFLAAIIKVQDDIEVAGQVLSKIQRDRTVTGSATLTEYLKPTLGVKIGRQPWFKGRSIKHCLDMSHGRMSCEEKIDGEYCQIHIDLSKGRNCIQIFSKSGKDSTDDRIALHDAIRRSLQLGQPTCRIRRGCILEGELVVYSDKDAKILDFHKIRKHVSRSGSFLGTDQDSQRHPWEHLMIVYYDLFMVDDESLLLVRQSERFKRLEFLIATIPGCSALVKREIIDCGKQSAASDLRRAFARCITDRREGLVLKPDDPYFNFDANRRPYSCCAIKLKKEYIGNFGDIGDFAVVGARFDVAKSKTYNIPNLRWTHFYIGCLSNKDEVQRFQRKPSFVVTNVLELNATQLQTFMTYINLPSCSWEDNKTISLRVEYGIDSGKKPTTVFIEPPVVDIRCFSFDKVGNTGFWSPRFPGVSKIHCDRTYRDTVSFRELQEMAAKEKEVPPPEDSQELMRWIAALENADPKSALRNMSQSTVATTEPPTSQSDQSSNYGHVEVASSFPWEGSSGIHANSAKGSAFEVEPSGKSVTLENPLTNCSHNNADTTTNNSPQAARGKKRALGAPPQQMSGREKARKCSKVGETGVESAISGANREALADVSEFSPRRNQNRVFVPRLSGVESMYQPNTETGAWRSVVPSSSLPASLSFHGDIPNQKRISATQPAPRSPVMTKRSSLRAKGFCESSPGACQYLGSFCSLANMTFLLSPCISGFLWITENLLAPHGVTELITDPKEWQGFPVTMTSTATTLTWTSTTSLTRSRDKIKKIALVETRRKEATTAFLNHIKEADLKRRNGGREWVCVFDWKVLGELLEEEKRCGRSGEKPGSRLDMNNGSSIWRRHWVGLA